MQSHLRVMASSQSVRAPRWMFSRVQFDHQTNQPRTKFCCSNANNIAVSVIGGQSLRFTVVGMRSGLGLGLGVMIGAHYFCKRRGSTEVQKSRNPWVSKMLTDPSQCLYPDTWPRLTPIHLDAWTMRIANVHTRSSSSLFSGGTHHLRLTQTDFLKSKCSLKCCWFALHAET